MINNSEFIAIIDDSEIFRNTVKKMLINFEYEFLEGSNGEEGLEVIKDFRDKISLLIIDLNMPKLNGIQVIEKMHQESIGKDIPIILFTSEPPKEFEDLRSRIPNLKAWMMKPIMEPKFIAVANLLLKNEN